MTTFIAFQPSLTSAFQFEALLDGNTYTVIVTWNLFGQCYYVNIYDLSNVLIVCIRLIGSPLDDDISMTAGYFATKLVYRTQNTQFEVI